MRLWWHPESDSLFLDEFQTDPLAEDVTDVAAYRVAARLRGLKFDYEGEDPEVTSRKTFASAITASYKKWERKPADLYPTPVDGTESVMPIFTTLRDKGCIGNRVWEPACGDGRMARVLEWHGFDVLATDLRDTPGHGIPGVDFLKEHHQTMGWWPQDNVDLIVTNPPFSLAEQFIRKALSITPNVAMLLKATYWNAASRLPFFEEHRPTLVLPLTWRLAFLESERGKSPLMDCIWVIWTAENEFDHCVFEPIRRLRYPGYAGKGLKGALASCEEALVDLMGAVRGATATRG